MKGGLRQSMAWLHTWSGLLLGWLLVAIFITGTSAYFRDEISFWMAPELHQSVASEATPQLAWARLGEQAPDARAWDIILPQDRSPVAELRWQPDTPEAAEGGRRRGERAEMDAGTGQILEPRASRGGDFLYRFHFELYGVPRIWARWLVCVATMMMLVAIISGVITHKKIFKDFFTFRPGKGQRSWLDAHNATAVLALPFHFMITYSGLLIFMILLMPWGFNAAYEDGWRGFFNEVFPRQEQSANAGAPAAMVGDILPLVNRAEARFGQPAQRISVSWPNRDNARIEISTAKEPALTERRRGGSPTLVFDGRGELLETRPGPPDDAAPARIYNLMVNLHLAHFADPATRWLFFLFGLVGSAMAVTGMLLWVSKRSQQLRGREPGFNLRLVNGLNMAAITGLLIAMAVYFAANRLLPAALEGRESWEIRAFFLAWLATLIHALWRPHRRGWLEQLAALAALWLAVPVIDLATTDSHLFSAIAWRHGALAAFDLVCLGMAAGAGYAFWRVAGPPPARKPARASRPRRATAGESS
ncbi:PepSY domain-containing protein [Alloalcanivorax gelatiniphagus]|uniref:PepSY domain-containing protein n=2 Tax=Alloalcanivorax gelatiniphagus TaxID=1194167 RepID=A0ABY2XL41_9GAMM|nr:PepSY domain-containing protein [Alloalcanivorax gelatiniphagus]